MSTSDVELGLSGLLGPPPALSPAQIEAVVAGALTEDVAASAPTVDVAFVDRALSD
ncbi:hypothetical protein [Rhodococcus sp. Eu-32]|uniref:hypothetical protein n=1 Tax=Rhodococcus sp. Eu-32 TaxID=1017319 RepID=UPI001402606A|nr:hypothetical protein [Rhodococcus sp. Eu-32]